MAPLWLDAELSCSPCVADVCNESGEARLAHYAAYVGPGEVALTVVVDPPLAINSRPPHVKPRWPGQARR
jgi:hypothetical protein